MMAKTFRIIYLIISAALLFYLGGFYGIKCAIIALILMAFSASVVMIAFDEDYSKEEEADDEIRKVNQ